MRRLAVLACAAFLASVGPSAAVRPDEMLADPKLESRARVLSEELRCLVCQNQSIDDSDAELAHDLRVLVRERIAAGDDDSRVLDYLVERYGRFVLLRPRFDLDTALLWTAPFAIAGIGGLWLFVAARRRRSAAAEVPLSAAEKARLDELLDRRNG